MLTVTSLYSLFSRFIWPTGYNVTFFVVLVGILCFIFGIYLYSALFIYYVSIFPLMYVHYDPLYAPLGCRWIMSRPTTDRKWPATAVAIGRGDP